MSLEDKALECLNSSEETLLRDVKKILINRAQVYALLSIAKSINDLRLEQARHR